MRSFVGSRAQKNTHGRRRCAFLEIPQDYARDGFVTGRSLPGIGRGATGKESLNWISSGAWSSSLFQKSSQVTRLPV